MAEDDNRTRPKIVRITQEELEISSKLECCESQKDLKYKSKKPSESRKDTSTARQSSSVGKLKSEGNGKEDRMRADGQEQDEDGQPAILSQEKKGPVEVRKMDDKLTKQVETTRLKKAKVREGYGVYQVKKGKYSDKMKISEELPAPKEKKSVGDTRRKERSERKSTSMEKERGTGIEHSSSTQKSIKMEQASPMQNDKVRNNEPRGKNKKSNRKPEDLKSNMDKIVTEKDCKLSGSQGQIVDKKEQKIMDLFQPGLDANKPNDLPAREAALVSKGENKDSEPTIQKKELKRINSKVEEEEQKICDKKKDYIVNEVPGNSGDKSNVSSAQEPNSVATVVTKREKTVTSKGIGRGKIASKGSSKKNFAEQVREGNKPIVRTKKSTDRMQYEASQQTKVNRNDYGSSLHDQLQNTEDGAVKNESKGEGQRKMMKEVKRKVKFSDTDKESCEQENDQSLEKLNKKGGVIYLPTPDFLDCDESLKEKQGEEETCKGVQVINGFQKLQRPPNTHAVRSRSGLQKADEKPKKIATDGRIWSKIKSEYARMKSMLEKRFLAVEDIEEILELSTLLQDLYKELIVNHQDFSFKNDVEGSLWKNTFHNVITKMRDLLDENTHGHNSTEIVQFYWNFLQNGDDFLQEILLALQDEWKFDLNAFVDNPLRMIGCKKQVKYAIRSCHLILLNLGDLERYITDLQQDLNYSKANDNYIKAQMLAPKNGKSYNQLAVVAVKSKKKLDAVYYYIRSLEASNPIESARERLTGIFHEIKKKADLTKKQSLQKSVMADDFERHRMEQTDTFDNDFSKHDTWIFFRGGQCHKLKLGFNGRIQELKNGESDELEEEIGTKEKVSLQEANKQFLVYYLYLHSKFYTKIGFEHIMTVYEDAMQSFKLLLNSKKAYCIKKENLVKYMAINIFSVNNLLKTLEDSSDFMKDSPIDVAIVFALDMVGRICQRCVILMESHDTDALDQLLPAVNTLIKWMCGYLGTVKCSSVCQMKDIWENIVQFLNAIRSYEVLPPEESEDGEPTGLFEDRFLCGFQPLSEMDKPSMNIIAGNQERAERLLRLESLKDIAFMISESGKLPVIYNVDSRSFEVLTPAVVFNSPTKNGTSLLLEENDNDFQDNDSDVIIEDVVEDIDDRELQYLKELKAKKMELTAKLTDQARKRQERATIMEYNASQVHVILENRPKYIVPDTNCFIDNLAGLERIVDSKDFDVILPLVVVNELDGLKKGRDVAVKCSSDTNSLHVKERARLAMEMLERRFSEGNTTLKALTSAGTELDSIAFRNEEFSQDKGKNDDIILSSCLHYCDESMTRSSAGDSPVRLQRCVVLLTDDRNLRLKAHSRQVPTVSLSVFLKMARLA